MNLKVMSIKICLCVSAVLFSSQLMAQSVKPLKNIDVVKHTDGPDTSYCHYAAVGFFNVLKENIDTKDKKAVAAMIKYPLWVQLNGKQLQIKNQEQFIEHYDAIITPKIEKIVQEQKIKGLISTYRGMAFGQGEIWFSNSCLEKDQKLSKSNDMKVIGINNFM